MKYGAQITALAAGIGIAIVAAPAAADFDGHLMSGQWFFPDWDSPGSIWEEIVDPDSPEYIRTFDDHPLDGYYFDLEGTTLEWKVSMTDYEAMRWNRIEVIAMVFTDVNDTMAAFQSLEMVDSQSSYDVDFSKMNYGVLNNDQFFIDFGPISGNDFFGNADGVTFEMTFVPAPAGGLLLLGAFTRRRRRN
jgi:hypothetical protein